MAQTDNYELASYLAPTTLVFSNHYTGPGVSIAPDDPSSDTCLSIAPSSVIPEQTITADTNDLELLISTYFAESPTGCTMAYSYSTSESTAVMSLDTSAGKFTFSGATAFDEVPLSSPWYKTITVTATAAGGSASADQSFDVKIYSPCKYSDNAITLPTYEAVEYDL